MGVKIGKSKGRSESGPTKTTRQRVGEIWNAAQGAAQSIPQPILQAQGTFGGAQTAGQAGLDALSGNPAAQQQFMNPYQQQVVDQLQAQFGVQNQNTVNQVNDAATRAGAFGGSRQAVAQGVALGENQRNQAGLLANVYQSGFDNSMNRAGQLAGLGLNAAGQGAELGMQAGSPDLWRLNTLRRGFDGTPYQTYGKQSSTNLGFSYNRPGQGG